MQLPGQVDPIFVDQPDSFSEMLEMLSKESIVAVDTESNSLFVYQEQVCLIQIATSTHDFLVDPLSFKDISGLNSIFSASQIEKVFHAAEYDLICLKRDFGFKFVNIFDTMIAGRTLGKHAIGLAAMLQEQLGIEVDKKYQKANWGQRPLSQEMLTYACLDAHYLIPLRNRLIAEVEKTGRLDWVKEDCAYLAKHSTAMKNHVLELPRTPEINRLKPRQLAVLLSLHEFRESVAKSVNKPPFKVFSNKALLQLAQSMPRHYQELELLPLLSKNQVRRYGKGLLAAIHRPPTTPIFSLGKSYVYNEAFQVRKEKLMDWRRDKGVELGVPSEIIISKDILSQIVEKAPGTLQKLRSIMGDVPLRYSLFGREIIDMLR